MQGTRLLLVGVLVLGACATSESDVSERLDALELRVEALEDSGQVSDRASEAAPTATDTAPATVDYELLTGTVTLPGLITVLGDDRAVEILGSGDNPACTGDNDFAGVERGAEIVVRGADDAVVAATRLKAGRYNGYHCVFAFETEVPSNLDFYTVEFGDYDAKTYSSSDLRLFNWTVTFKLGS